MIFMTFVKLIDNYSSKKKKEKRMKQEREMLM